MWNCKHALINQTYLQSYRYLSLNFLLYILDAKLAKKFDHFQKIFPWIFMPLYIRYKSSEKVPYFWKFLPYQITVPSGLVLVRRWVSSGSVFSFLPNENAHRTQSWKWEVFMPSVSFWLNLKRFPLITRSSNRERCSKSLENHSKQMKNILEHKECNNDCYKNN